MPTSWQDNLPSSLLLLPSPPSPSDAATLGPAYRPSVHAALAKLKARGQSSKLIVGLAWAELDWRRDLPRPQIYDDAVQLLAGLYSIISQVSAKLDIEIDAGLPGAIDVHVILLDHGSVELVEKPVLGRASAGPVVDFSTFACTRRKWQHVFSVEGEPGQKLLADYLLLARTQGALSAEFHRVQGGISLKMDPLPLLPSKGSATDHRDVAVGGTFDHLHAGHKLLLTATALLLQREGNHLPSSNTPNRRIVVGITGPALLVNKKYAEQLNPWKKRATDVIDFLESIISFTNLGPDEAVDRSSLNTHAEDGVYRVHFQEAKILLECVELDNPYGPPVHEEGITALVVSAETRAGGSAINEMRVSKGWKEMEIFEVDVLDAEEAEAGSTKPGNFDSKISSTALRKHRAELALQAQEREVGQPPIKKAGL